jgi:acyl carrier protein
MAEVLQVEEREVTPELAIHRAGTWNSLTHIELVVGIEQAFGVQLTDDEIVAMTSVGEIRRVLRGHGIEER